MGILDRCRGKKDEDEYHEIDAELPGGRRSLGAQNHVNEQDIEAQRSKCYNCLHSKATLYSLMGLNGLYTIVISILFATFAYRRSEGDVLLGIFYSSCSFLMNAPMAWFFAEGAVKAFKRLGKMEKSYMVAFTLAIILATGTTGAGYQVATESVEEFKSLPQVFVSILTFFSAFNTFSTRLIGSVFLLYTGSQLTINLINRHRAKYRVFYQLLEDIKRYGDKTNIRFPVNQQHDPYKSLQNYARRFYRSMPVKGLRPGETWLHTAKKAVLTTATATIVTLFIINMMPLWLKLTAQGIKKISFMESLSKSKGVVWFAAVSNEFFYLQSAIKFFPSLISVAAITTPKIKAKWDEASYGKRLIIGTSVLSAIALCGIFGYYSGEGYGEDGLESMKNGFGKIADETWFSWFAGSWTNLFMPVYDDFVAATSAGLIVNGGSALRFMMTHVPFFKPVEEQTENDDGTINFGAKEARKLLKSAIEQGDLRAFAGVKAPIMQYREAVTPRHSLWAMVSHPAVQKIEVRKFHWRRV